MIIDTHTHLFADDVRENRQSYCRRDEGFRLLYENEKARMASLEDLLRVMDRDGVDRSVICGFPWKDPGLCREGNHFLLHCSRKIPGRFIPFACLPFHSLRLAERELELCLSQGIQGIGELGFYRRRISFRDVQRLSSILKPLSGWGIPFLLHASEPVGHEYPGKNKEDFQLIYQLLLALPDLNIILAHWGGGFIFYELMPEVARATRNVFYDTAASPLLYRFQIYNLAVKIAGPQRILFGSDFPLLVPSRYFKDLQRSQLPNPIQAKIKGLNAKKIFLDHPKSVNLR